MKKKYIKILQMLVGFTILFFFFRAIGISEFWEVLKKINLFWLIPLFLITLLTQAIATINLAVVLKAINKKAPFSYLFRAVTLTFSLGTIAPGRTGDFSLVFFLKNKGIDYGHGLATTLLDKMISFFVISLLALFGIFWFLNLKLFWTIFIFSFLSIFISIFVISSKNIRNIIKKYVLRKYSKHFKGFYKSFRYILKKRKRYVFLDIIITILRLVVSFLSTWFVFKAFNQSIPFYYIIFVSSIISIVTLIPISFSGLGIKEGLGTYMYSSLGNIAPSISMNVMIILTMRKYTMALLYYLVNIKLMDNLKIKKIIK